jgi:hypothetical protein
MRRITFWIIVFIFSLLFAAQRAHAQQGKDLLKELDEKPPAEQGKKPEAETAGKAAKAWNPLDQLQKNFEGSARLRYTGYFNPAEERPEADTKRNQGEVLLRFADWVGDKKLRLDISGWLEAGTQKNTYAGVTDSWQETDHRRNYLELNELYLTTQQKDFTVYLGKRLFPNGIATLYSPADILRPRDMNDPLDWKYFGIWQGRMDYFWKESTLTAALLPVFQPWKLPSSTSRWAGNPTSKDSQRDPTFTDPYPNVQDDIPEISGGNVGYFTRGKTTVRGFDLYSSLYYGPGAYPVLRQETQPAGNVYIKEHVKVTNLAAGFSTTYKKWEFHGEVLYNYSLDGKDDSYLPTLAGFTYTLDEWVKPLHLDKIDITLEYAYEFLVRSQFAPGYVESSRKARYGRNDIYTRLDFKFSEKLSVEYLNNLEFTKGNRGRYQRLMGRYRLRDGLVGRAGVEFFEGAEDSYYGRWNRNDRLLAELEWSL